MRRIYDIFQQAKVNFLFFFPLFLYQSNGTTQDNLAIFQNLTLEIVHSVFEDISPDSSTTVSINSQDNREEGKWLIENGFIRYLLNKNLNIELGQAHNSDKQIIIEFQISRIGVQYFPISKKDELKRQINLELQVRVRTGISNKILLLKDYKKQYTDSVRITDIKRIENNNYPFTQGKLPEKWSFKILIEPVIVLITSATVIYLFFTLRSK